MDGDGVIDHPGFTRLVEHLVDAGSDGIVVAGTTGESPTLTAAEKLDLVRRAVDAVGERATVVAGTGSYDTRATIELTRQAAEAGAQAALVVTPYYSKPPRAGLVAHFTAIADASPIPIVLYNIPGRSVINLDPELVAELAAHPRIVAIKQAQTDDLDETRRIRELAPDLAVYAGNDDALLDILRLGGVGGICVASHVIGTAMSDLCSLVAAGDDEAAARLDASLRPVYEAMAVTTNPIPVKAALDILGLPGGGLRLPLVPATRQERDRIASALEAAGLAAGARS